MYNKFVTLFFVTFMMVAVTACNSSPFENEPDPLADQPESIKKGEPPQKEKPPKEKPLPQDVLKIDSSDYYVFREGVEQEVTITARSFFEDSIYDVQITNLVDFKDAVVQYVQGDKKNNIPASLKMRWTPPSGLVIQDQLALSLDLMVFTANDGEKYSYKKSVPLFVYREEFLVPKVINFEKSPIFVKENSTPTTFLVNVEDFESQNADGFKPSLIFLSKNLGGVNIAPFLQVQKTTLKNGPNGLWQFEVAVDLKNLELTSRVDTGYFDVAVVSSKGVRSNPVNGSFMVWTSVTAPQTTWGQKIEFKIGAENRFSFTVFDPKSEGNISANFVTQCSQLPGNPNCECKPVAPPTAGAPRTSMMCQIVWNVPANMTPGRQAIRYTINNASPIYNDTELKTSIFDGFIELVK